MGRQVIRVLMMQESVRMCVCTRICKGETEETPFLTSARKCVLCLMMSIFICILTYFWWYTRYDATPRIIRVR